MSIYVYIYIFFQVSLVCATSLCEAKSWQKWNASFRVWNMVQAIRFKHDISSVSNPESLQSHILGLASPYSFIPCPLGGKKSQKKLSLRSRAGLFICFPVILFHVLCLKCWQSFSLILSVICNWFPWSMLLEYSWARGKMIPAFFWPK